MLQSIVAAVLAVLKSVFSCARKVVSLPFRVLNAILGGGSDIDIAPAPELAPEESDEAPSPKLDWVKIYENLALSVMRWCVESVELGQPAPVPPKMPRGISEWLPGLREAELVALVSAGRIGISAHIRSQELVPGVRSMQRLAAIKWPEKPRPEWDRGFPSFVSFADAGSSPSPDGAATLRSPCAYSRYDR
jgi:hypothetical protein